MDYAIIKALETELNQSTKSYDELFKVLLKIFI